MMMIIQACSMTVSLLLVLLTHPLSLGLTLLLQTISVSLIIGYYHYNFWYSYILFLIMIGGMLVLFAYMTSVASNEKFKFSIRLLSLIIFMSITVIIIQILLDSYFSHLNNLSIESMTAIIKFNLSLSKYLTYPSNILTIGLIVYLLIALIAVVKITNVSSGPLRHSN